MLPAVTDETESAEIVNVGGGTARTEGDEVMHLYRWGKPAFFTDRVSETPAFYGLPCFWAFAELLRFRRSLGFRFPVLDCV